MISIVIADDEKLIRAGIKKIIKDNIEVPLEIFEAKNGSEALELCKTENPNVLITDIRMPILDGVELMKSVSQLEVKPTIIVLSGFDDFVYAKAAIQNGAMSYILKPVDKKELIISVQQAISEYQKEQQKNNEQALRSIIDEGRIDYKLGIDNSKFPNGYYCLCIMGKHSRQYVEETFKSSGYYTLESKKNYECIVIPRETKLMLDSAASITNQTIGVSNSSDNLSALRTYKKQAFIAMLNSFFNPSIQITYYAEDVSIDYSKIDELYEHSLAKLTIASNDDVQKQVNKFLDFTSFGEKEKPFALEYLYNRICSSLFVRYPSYTQNDSYLQLKSIMIENIWQYQHISEWTICVMDYFIYLAALLKKQNIENPHIEKALEYIHQNFSKNINMAMVANQVNINYTWFSEKFKEHTGVNFNEYIKKIRIDEACRLLEKGCYKIYEVAERSGFSDPKYFAKIFKESTGFSPGEWKASHEE